MGVNVHVIIVSLVVWEAASKLIIDVSHHNGRINWAKVKAAGVEQAIAKATEGNTFQDNKFVQNWEGMKRNSITPGAYHYLRGAQTAESQVTNIKSMLQRVDFDPDTDMVAIDVEEGQNENVSKEKMAATLKGVLEGLQGKYKNLWIYTGPSYWENKVAWRNYDFSKYKLWIAHYTGKPQPNIPSTWRTKGHALWQYEDVGRVNGIRGNVDMNRV